MFAKIKRHFAYQNNRSRIIKRYADKALYRWQDLNALGMFLVMIFLPLYVFSRMNIKVGNGEFTRVLGWFGPYHSVAVLVLGFSIMCFALNRYAAAWKRMEGRAAAAGEKIPPDIQPDEK
jgi:hypothetical protein